MKVGVLALQGDVSEHLELLRPFVAAVPVRTTDEFDCVDALVMPGGESTTLAGLLDRSGLLVAIGKRLQSGMPAFGTCAGAILLATNIAGGDVPHLSAIDIDIERNAYGRQVDSFESIMDVHGVGTLTAVFIRAPVISRTGTNVKTLASANGSPVVVQQGRVLVCTFHPELAGHDELHRYFVEKVCEG